MKLDTEKIKQLMVEQGLKVDDLARKTRRKPQWIYYILQGKSSHTFKTLELLAKYLKVSPLELLKE